MQKEFKTPMVAGIIIAVVIVLGAIGYFALGVGGTRQMQTPVESKQKFFRPMAPPKGGIASSKRAMMGKMMMGKMGKR